MLASIFGSVAPVTVDLALQRGQSKRKASFSIERQDEKGWVFTDGETLSGVAAVHFRPGKPIEQLGLKLELIGRIETSTTKGSRIHDFLTMSKELEPPGTMTQPKSYEWQFKSCEMPHDTYRGLNARLRYFLRLTFARQNGRNVTKELDFIVQNSTAPPVERMPIKIEVGIEDCLHIELNLANGVLELNGCIYGEVHFSVVRLKIRHMQLDIIRQETVGGLTTLYSTSTNTQSANEPTDSQWTTGVPPTNSMTHNSTVVTQFELMDGIPAKGETVPVRMFLRGLHLTPSYENVQNMFSVRHFINLVLVDEEDRRYFKKQEVFFYRDNNTKHPMGENAFASLNV
eukprot:Blabericola_migrator_1__3198@NODE_193_length_11571_cov_33_434805_g166_i0_p6_GENE_NODE_193_length_11571_cov_33_434805_g166_i0NODE_193_length_11571_cov_33_434805_g166_i0_p6_ORF_typecomplete_len343_score41_45Vps26/PF03643_15/1_2e75Arrestin_N/PF00339_29/1_3e05Arrestin_N/PF00339_29/5_2e02_NODE_193_length_11571_cov_33_434805_g166_i017392767